MSKRKHKNAAVKDYHHFLYQSRYWKQGYARKLRQHPYLGAYLPQFTLHSEIHAKIHDIPTPKGEECRRAYNELIRLEKEGLIDVRHDTAEQRLDFLIQIWQRSCPATVAILQWQRDIIRKFYQRGAVK